MDELVIPFQAELKGIYSNVLIRGQISRGDLLDLLGACEKLQSNVLAQARWELYEPAFLLTLKGEKTGQVELECDASMDQMTEQHKFVMRLDQTYIFQAVNDLRALLRHRIPALTGGQRFGINRQNK